jgi:hypothetical protein
MHMHIRVFRDEKDPEEFRVPFTDGDGTQFDLTHTHNAVTVKLENLDGISLEGCQLPEPSEHNAPKEKKAPKTKKKAAAK